MREKRSVILTRWQFASIFVEKFAYLIPSNKQLKYDLDYFGVFTRDGLPMGWGHGSEWVNHGRRSLSGSRDWRSGTTRTLPHPTTQCGENVLLCDYNGGPPLVYPWTWDVAERGGYRIGGEVYPSLHS